MQPHSLLATAQVLLSGREGKSSQCDLRRAHSTIYYALFHCLARDAADVLAGDDGSPRSNRAWVQVYRALNHGKVFERCESEDVYKFPIAIQEFASAFKLLQLKREAADYDPTVELIEGEVVADLDVARDAIGSYLLVEEKHRRAFAVYLLIERRAERRIRKQPKRRPQDSAA